MKLELLNKLKADNVKLIDKSQAGIILYDYILNGANDKYKGNYIYLHSYKWVRIFNDSFDECNFVEYNTLENAINDENGY